MKSLRKIMALLIAMVMVLGMSISAFADVANSQTISQESAANGAGKYTISVNSGDTHTYKVYQILTGTLIAGESKLGNPVWGADAKGGENNKVEDFINAITATGLSNVEIDDLVKAQLKDDATGQGTVSAGSSMDVVPGYYFLVDTTEGLADGDAKSLNIVAVFNDIEVTPKKGTTVSEKHVDDVNDSNANDHSELKDSADYDIGDSVPYTLTFTLPEDYANYKKYYVNFVDDMSAGLTYNGDAKIFYGSADTEGTDIIFAPVDGTEYTGGQKYSYEIADLKTGTDEQKALRAGAVIKITYTATLNAKAVVGSAGNPNKYLVEFSSNPNESGEGKPEINETPEDVNIVFTFKTIFNKVDGEGKPLEGADFTLFKKVGNDWVNVTALNSGEGAANPTKTKDTLTNGNGTAANAKFTFAGLDAGDYKLEETTTPTGYNTIDPIEFTITAKHKLESDNPVLEELTGAGGAEFTMTSDTTAGSLTADIENNQGSELPSTGGMGTTLFYIVGGILVAGAAIILIAKRKVNA